MINALEVYNSETDNLIKDFTLEEHFNPKGTIEKDDNDNYRYKINMTGHINDIINNDSTNVKLKVRVKSPSNEIGGSVINKNDIKLEINYSKQK